jgi:DNA polymerase-3 subunit delta
MVALKKSEFDTFLARPQSAWPVVLVYGPDAGLVHERAQALISKAVEDPKDPFQLARLDGDELAGEPTRLVEEANTIPLFGGRRAVWVKAGTRNLAPAVEALMASDFKDCRVILEAGELRKSAPLRTVIERAKNAVALPCYPDDEKDLLRLIDEEMRASGLGISAESRAALLPLLGGDRLASRQELRKLALFARGKARVETQDVIAVVTDASALEVDELIDAAFAGRPAEVESQLGKARIAGTTPGTIFFAALRQLSQLHKGRLAIEQGDSIGEAAASVQTFGQFGRKSAIETALRQWTAERLVGLMAQLAQAALAARRQPSLATEIVERALLSIALSARRKS